MSKIFDLGLVFSQIPQILEYLPVTLELAIISYAVSLVFGLIIALIKINKTPVFTQIANVFISVIRGTPIIVQLYVVYFGIPLILKAINLKLGTNLNVNGIPSIIYAFVALAINESAFNAEIIRGALSSVKEGQIEAGHALGMSTWQVLYRIVIPEALVVAFPSLINSFIGLIKGTSLAFTCSVVEMTAQAKILGGRNFRYFEAYCSLAIIYWLITVILEQIAKRVEQKMAIPDDAPEIKKIEERA
ncbi:MAG: amino acid ABC transporter permease [Bacillota bacterium]|nr:amino acid ABC transporter permease [Bacillota bacterium]